MLPALLWIILLFAATAGLPRCSSHEEETHTAIALRLAATPSALFCGKLAYGLTLIFALELLIDAALSGDDAASRCARPACSPSALAAGGYGLAAGSTLVAAIIAQARGKGTLFAVLALPRPPPPAFARRRADPQRGRRRAAPASPCLSSSCMMLLSPSPGSCSSHPSGILEMDTEEPSPLAPLAVDRPGRSSAPSSWAPPAKSFVAGGESSRILFFHVPMAWVSFVAFLTAGVRACATCWRTRPASHDRAAAAAVQLGLLFGVLATVTGALWARYMWGAYWNWDPRQTLDPAACSSTPPTWRCARPSRTARRARRLAAAYAVLGLVVAPFLYLRAAAHGGFTLHPEPVVNAAGKVDMDPAISSGAHRRRRSASPCSSSGCIDLRWRIVAARQRREALDAAGTQT